MNVRTKKPRQTHGSHIAAPSEEGADSLREGVAGDGAPPLWAVRLLGVLKVMGGVVLVVGTSLSVAWGAYRYALTSPRFAITQLELQGAARLSETDVSRAAGIERGQNIFTVDTQLAESRLLENPWVEQVKVTRTLPGTLRIELKERDAQALAAAGNTLYLVSRSGEPFKRFNPADDHDLPTITGLSPENLARDRAREIERIQRGLEILRQYERTSLSRVHVAQEVHLAENGEAVLTVGKAGVALHLGHGPWRKKLLMAERVLGQLQQRRQVPGSVFLDNRAHPERVVVRLR